MSRAALLLSVLALFVAGAGSGLAASGYLLTNVGQIKPSVVRRLRGRRGPRGLPGVPGPAGARGLAGPRGEAGSEASLERLCNAIFHLYESAAVGSYTESTFHELWTLGCGP